LGALIGVLMLTTASCGDDDSSSGDASGGSARAEAEDATTTTDASATTVSDEDEVLAAYRTAIDAVEAAFDPPDPNHPDLLATHAGDSLEGLQATLEQIVNETVLYVGAIEPHPTVKSLVADEAVIEDCSVNHEQLIDRATREPKSDETEEVVLIESHLARIDGTWKIISEQELGEPCTPE
jgi:hypothetical protein